MDADLLAFGIDLTHELDRRFGLEPKITMSQVRCHVTTPAKLLCRSDGSTAFGLLSRCGTEQSGRVGGFDCKSMTAGADASTQTC